MAVIHLKLKSINEIRRISIEKQSSFDSLRQVIAKLFQGTCLNVNYSIKYEDEDKDLISVVSDSDWQEAINFAESRNGNLILLLGEPLEVYIAPSIVSPIDIKQDDEVSALEKEFIFLSSVLPRDAIEQAMKESKDVFDVAKEKIQTLISEDIPQVFSGNAIQNFIQNIQDMVKKVEEDVIGKKLESLSQNQEPPRLSAKLIQDVSIADGAIMTPNTHFTKVWEVNNDGNCSWPVGTQLRPISAIRLSSEASYEIQANPAGNSIEISVDMVAPAEPGKYRSFYRLFHPDTLTPFGDIIWVDIVVPQPYKFQDQLNSLVEMGFDESVCRFLLEEHNGNVEECMVELTN